MTDEETKEQGTPTNVGEGVQQETTNQFDRASKTIQELKEQNDRKEALLQREETLAAQKLLAGQSEAGIQTDKKEEETNEAYVDRMRKNGWKANG